MKRNLLFAVTACMAACLFIATMRVDASVPATVKSDTLTPLESLGRDLFFDANLSEPAGQSCATCHVEVFAFTEGKKLSPTSPGVNTSLFGNRNTPTAMYMAFSPPFAYDKAQGKYVGGQFWDGRAADLAAQAKGPFLNPIEMANPDKSAMISKIKLASYADQFKSVFGQNVFDNAEVAYDNAADAIAAFEKTARFSPFSSKYDAYLAGKVRLTDQEARGLLLFENVSKGNCAACHTSRASGDTPALFTNFGYENIGTPRNPSNQFYKMPKAFNPDGANFIDIGLGATTGDKGDNGKFKVPTLRNIALTSPYMHNGYFTNLQNAVDFHNTRDSKPACSSSFLTVGQALMQKCWPAPEVSDNKNMESIGNLNLSSSEVDDIVAFLNTLTDGYAISYNVHLPLVMQK